MAHAATGLVLAADTDDGSSEAKLVEPSSTPMWNIFRVCQGGSVAIVDDRSRALAVTNDGKVNVDASGGRANAWVLVRPCPSEERAPPFSLVDGGGQWQDCWATQSGWSGAAADCCSTSRYGPRGNPSCFDAVYSFERCCPEASESEVLPEVAVSPSLLCSGERIDGEERSVQLSDFNGDRQWTKSTTLLRNARFDFSSPEKTPDSPKTVRVVDSLPRCGGPQLLDEVTELMPDTEQHMVVIFKSLHNAMMRVVESSQRWPG